MDFALRTHRYFPMIIEGKDIPRRDSVQYLGIFLDKKLNYKEHVKIKCNELNLRLLTVILDTWKLLTYQFGQQVFNLPNNTKASMVLRAAAMGLYN